MGQALRRGPSQLSVSRPLAGGPIGRQPGGAGYSVGLYLAWSGLSHLGRARLRPSLLRSPPACTEARPPFPERRISPRAGYSLGTRSPAGQAGRGPGDPWEVGNQATSRVCSTQPLSALARGRFQKFRLRGEDAGPASLYEALGFRPCRGISNCTHIIELGLGASD